MISFIIPAYNEEKYISATLRNLKRLKSVPFEIVVSDDCSSDQTVAVARELADLVVLGNARDNATISAARNRGAAQAHYPYLVFLDSTVRIADPDKFFAIALDCFKKDPQLVGLASYVRVEPESAKFPDNLIFGAYDLWYRFATNVLHIGLASGKFQMVQAEAFRKSGGFNEALAAGEDIEFFGRLGKLGHLRLEPKLTIYHSGRRVHAMGWPKVIGLWTANAVAMILFKKSASKVWEAIR